MARLARVLGMVCVLAAAQAWAATFTVTKTADTADGVCDADCSLREAVIAANAAAGADTITLPAGTYPLTLAFVNSCAGGPPCPWDETASLNGDLDIAGALTIQGAGARTTILDQQAQDRVIDVLSGAATILDVTITGGDHGGYPELTGAASLTTIGIGGGVHVAPGASLTLRRSAVVGNAARLGAVCFIGSCNSTGPSGGGVAVEGSALIEQSLIANNSVANAAGTTTGVPSPGKGAGLFASAATTVRNSTVTGNFATVTPPVTNTASNQFFAYGATLTLEASTATPSFGVIVETGVPNALGGFTTDPATQVLFRNMIAAVGLPCSNSAAGQSVQQGFSILGSNCGAAGPSDLIANPLLGALADNGGPTDTMAPGAGSPAIDSGDPALALSVDQTGAARPQDGDANGVAIIDRGAFEVRGPATPPCGTAPTGAYGSGLALYAMMAGAVALVWRRRRG